VVETIEPKVSELKDYESKINAVRNDMKQQEETAEPFLKAVRDREAWTKIVDEVHSRLPKDYIWITSFAPEERKPEPTSTSTKKGAPAGPQTPAAPRAAYVVRGLYLENPQGPSVVDEFKTKLDESPLFHVDKNPDSQTRSAPNDTTWAYDYSFTLVLGKPEPEKPKAKK